MVIRTVATLALYCSRCGKIQMHNFSRFTFSKSVGQQLLCSCGQLQATITSVSSHQCLLDIPCVICQTNHIICLESKRFWQTGMDKIYCVQENFELGFVGDRKRIADTIAGYKREFEKLLYDMDAEGYEEYVENPQVMIEVLNKIHDLAERGQIYCRCGCNAVGAELLPDAIQLECAQCGGHVTIQAHDEQDLLSIEAVDKIELISLRRSRRKH